MCFTGVEVLMTLASTAVSAMGAMMQGQQAAALARAQQDALNQQAEADRRAAAYESAREFEKGQRAQSRGLVATAASGVTLEGSPTEALAENAKQNQMDIAAIQYSSQLRQNNLRTQGEIARFKGEQAQSAAGISAIGNIFSGLSSLYKPSGSFQVGRSGFSGSSPFAGVYS